MGSFGLKNGIAGGRLVVCAGEMESFDFARPIGIGLVESAANLSRILSKNEGEIREVIFVGTCGLYNANAPLMQVFESRAAANVEASAVMDWGYSPIINLAISGEISGKIAAKYVVNPADQARDPLTIFPIVSRETMLINSSNYITTDVISLVVHIWIQ